MCRAVHSLCAAKGARSFALFNFKFSFIMSVFFTMTALFEKFPDIWEMLEKKRESWLEVKIHFQFDIYLCLFCLFLKIINSFVIRVMLYWVCQRSEQCVFLCSPSLWDPIMPCFIWFVLLYSLFYHEIWLSWWEHKFCYTHLLLNTLPAPPYRCPFFSSPASLCCPIAWVPLSLQIASCGLWIQTLCCFYLGLLSKLTPQLETLLRCLPLPPSRFLLFVLFVFLMFLWEYTLTKIT